MPDTHFAKFTEASNKLLATLKGIPATDDPVMTDFARLIWASLTALSTAQRFYVPNGANIIEKDTLSRSEVSLPYPCIAILDEVDLLDDITDLSTKRDSTWKISIAFTPDSELNLKFKLIPDNQPFGVLSLVEVNNLWTCTPGVITCAFEGEDGYVLRAADMECSKVFSLAIRKDFSIEREFTQDVYSIVNLCTILSLHNVKTRTITPPEKLQKKRLKHGGKPLFSYKVLVVDGEEWHDSGNKGTGTGSVRSHMRRGHIRQLHNSDRRVWVRATLVHGKAAGFVSKDYKINA